MISGGLTGVNDPQRMEKGTTRRRMSVNEDGPYATQQPKNIITGASVNVTQPSDDATQPGYDVTRLPDDANRLPCDIAEQTFGGNSVPSTDIIRSSCDISQPSYDITRPSHIIGPPYDVGRSSCDVTEPSCDVTQPSCDVRIPSSAASVRNVQFWVSGDAGVLCVRPVPPTAAHSRSVYRGRSRHRYWYGDLWGGGSWSDGRGVFSGWGRVVSPV